MTKAARWGWIVAAVAATGVVLLLAFVLSFATRSGLYERHFAWLFWLNAAVVLLLALVVGLVALRLVARVRRGKFGSRLLIKLAGIFALVGVLPGLVIYIVSYQFASRSIEAWFDVRVAGALDAGLALGRLTLETLAGDLTNKTRLAAEQLDEAGAAALPLALERLREQLGAREVALLGALGQPLLVTSGATAAAAPERPSATLLRRARAAGAASQIDGLDEESLAPGGPGARLRALARVPSSRIALAGAE
ncbi:MAG: PAS domain-containing sensor histidine kinase, partial [Comamonadaceae bacterium]|nr:PAS domain-containing sensor histidine kinase [Comamonadaceae bacterium]